jgi:hypothetical protein
MEELHAKCNPERKRVDAIKETNEIVYRIPGDRSGCPESITDNAKKLGYVQSVHTQIESASPPGMPFRSKPESPVAGRLRASHTGPVSSHPNNDLPSPSPLYGRTRPVVKHNSAPIGSRGVARVFIPSNRNFDMHRHPQNPGARAGGRESVVWPNEDHPDIQSLRKALKPVLTGDKVRKVVEGFESRAVRQTRFSTVLG